MFYLVPETEFVAVQFVSWRVLWRWIDCLATSSERYRLEPHVLLRPSGYIVDPKLHVLVRLSGYVVDLTLGRPPLPQGCSLHRHRPRAGSLRRRCAAPRAVAHKDGAPCSPLCSILLFL